MGEFTSKHTLYFVKIMKGRQSLRPRQPILTLVFKATTGSESEDVCDVLQGGLTARCPGWHPTCYTRYRNHMLSLFLCPSVACVSLPASGGPNFRTLIASQA